MGTDLTDLQAKRDEILNRTARPEIDNPRVGRKQSNVEKAADRLAKLQAAAESSQRRTRVHLPRLSTAYGAMIEADLVDVSVQEVMASGILPGNARQVVSDMIARSEELSAEDRQRVGMVEIANTIANEEYGGDLMYVYSGMLQLSRALACLGTRQILFDGEPNVPEITLSMVRDDTKAHSLYIGLLDDEDLNALSGVVWQNLEEDAREAEPFPRTVDAADAVSQIEKVRGTAARTDEV